MTDKEKIHQILSSLWKNDDSVGKMCYNQALQDVQTAIDLQEEPVSHGQVKESMKIQRVNNTCKENGNSLTQEPVSEGLGEYINELSKQFPEVSFAKLSRIAVRVAKWQKEQIKKTMDLGEPPYLISVEQAYYRTLKLLEE